MGNFEVEETPLKGLFVGQILSKKDERGYFERVYCIDEYESLFARPLKILQVNRSLSREEGTVRGFHFQRPPFAETKIVSCPKGGLYDVAIDLRKGSATYLQSYGVELTPENKKFLLVPEGFGHGFQTLRPDTEVLYFVTQKFSPEHDDGINPLDPDVGVKWPREISVMSAKDSTRPWIKDRNFTGINPSG